MKMINNYCQRVEVDRVDISNNKGKMMKRLATKYRKLQYRFGWNVLQCQLIESKRLLKELQ